MKKLFFTTLTAVIMTSCMTTYYQVYRAVPSEKITVKEKFMIYEDENCKVSYNLWDEKGNIGFKFYNKTDKNIYINLEESFFVINGMSYNYYLNRVFSNSTSIGVSTSRSAYASKSVTGINYSDLIQTNKISFTNSLGATTSSGYSVSYIEEKIVCIPSMTSKIISEYHINQALFRDCDLFKYPSKKEIKTKNFTKSDSPLIFSNRIVYSVGQSGIPVKLENEFYVTEITNYPESEMFDTKYDEFCGQKSMVQTKYFKYESPDKFYIKCEEQDIWEH